MTLNRRTFLLLLAALTLVKLVLAASLPLTGDEAYFYLWAKYPELGYYDHPPMVGWWLHLLLPLGTAEWWLRLPAVALTSFIGWAVYAVLRGEVGERQAAFAGLLYLLAPVNLIDVLISTDTPLILFSFLSVLALRRALATDGYRWFAIAGGLLGLAFLSKYFAVLLGLTYGIYLLLVRRSARNALGLLLLFLAVLPFAAFNIWWNYANCWDNILFNLINRHSGGEGGWRDALLYLVMVVYLVLPPLLWYAWQRRGDWRDALRGGDLYAWIWLLPMLLFGALSFVARIGLHWVLAFYPFLFMLLPRWLNERQLRRSATALGLFSLLHVAAVVAVLVLPPAVWQGRPVLRHDITFGRYNAEFWRRIEPFAAGHALATDSYVYSAILEHTSGARFAVMGVASKYGRQDDVITDWRALDGKGVAVLLYAGKGTVEYARYFERTRLYPVTVRGVTDVLLVGEGFRYSVYRDAVLERVRQQFYRRPWFLPCGTCYFYDKYFPGQPMEPLPRP